jgi:DNA (cytosine-5)-methyltransferase 1
MYIVFWKKGNKTPDLEYRPKAYCPLCSKDVHAVQHWKNPEKKFGKYKQQYLYRCPADGMIVEPYYYAALNCIDWMDIGQRIGDREKPLSENTINRINYGLKRYGNKSLILHALYGKEARGVVRSVDQFAFTQTTIPTQAVLNPFMIKGEHTLQQGYVKSVADNLQTQTVRQSMGIVVPFLIDDKQTTGINFRVRSVENSTNTMHTSPRVKLVVPPFVTVSRGKSTAHAATDPISTQSQMINHGIVTSESFNSFISAYNTTGHSLKHISEPTGAVTAMERLALVNYETPQLEDCYYRMLKPKEIKLSMAFDQTYTVLGSGKDQVKQLGNAVTPPVMEWLVNQVAESLL